MTTAAANVAGQSGEKDKDKVEKRRALGRGLASLLPGPRVVTPAAAPAAPSAAPPARAASATPSLPHGTGAASALAERAAVSGSVSSLGSSGAGASAPDGSAKLRSTGEASAAVATYSPGSDQAAMAQADRTLEVVWPEDKLPGPDGRLAYNSQAADGTFTMHAAAETRMPGNLVFNLAIADIDKNPFQTRYVDDNDALEELAESIKVNGVVQPVLVRPSEDEDGRYVLIMGERRLHASKKAGKTHIPALVRRVSRQQAAEMTIIENLQREDLSPLEQAQAFKVLSEEFNLTQQQIGERVGLARASVANYMRLLKLPHVVMELLAQKSLTFAEAKELLALENADQMAQAAIYAVNKGMTAEQIERMVLSMNGLLEAFPGMPGQKKKSGGARWMDPNVRAAQTDLERTLGLRVRIRDRKGKGKIVIEYATVDDYERVVEMLGGKK